MEIKRSHLMMAILLIGGLVMGATFTSVQARYEVANTKDDKADSQAASGGTAWEYCTVTKGGYTVTNRTGLYWITYFKSSGFQVVDVEDNATSNAALAKAIARLGDEGWEMVDVGVLEVRPGSKLDAYYFKRPRQRP